MSIASDLSEFLRGVSSVTESISGKTVGVYAVAAPQKSANSRETVQPPFILVTNLEKDYGNTLDSQGRASQGLKRAELDVDCKGVTELEAETVKEAVEGALEDYTGAAGDSVIESIDFDDCSDELERPTSGQGLPIFTKTLEVVCFYI